MILPKEWRGKLIKELTGRKTMLASVRTTFEPSWISIRDYIMPFTAQFDGEQTDDGTRQDSKIINTAPRMAIRTLASGMQSGVTSPLRPWFRLGTSDPQLQEFQPVKLWLADVERILREIFSKSNIYDRLKSNYGILGGYGTSALFIDDDAQDVVRAHDLLTGSFYIATNESGRVDTLFRCFDFSVLQLVKKFGIDAVPKDVRDQYERGDYHVKYKVLHVVEPNRLYKIGSALPQFKQYASVWMLEGRGEDEILRYSGFDDMPMMCPRWDVVGHNAYGVGCGDVALGDAKQLQLLEKRKLQGIDKNVNPAMVADSSMRNQRTSNLPGDTIYVNGLAAGSRGYHPAYQVNPYINELREEISSVEQRIDEAFYKNLFLVVTDLGDQPNITATQISSLREEKLLMLGPVLERLNDELLDPLIDRVFNIAMRRGMLPPPPQKLSGQQLKVEYISVLAQAQKAMGLGNIERYVGFVGQMAQFNPDALDKINLDAAIDEYADGTAVPPGIVRSEEEVSALRQQRAQQQQMAQQMAMAAQGAQTAKDLSQVNLEGDNAVTRAMQMAGMQ